MAETVTEAKIDLELDADQLEKGFSKTKKEISKFEKMITDLKNKSNTKQLKDSEDIYKKELKVLQDSMKKELDAVKDNEKAKLKILEKYSKKHNGLINKTYDDINNKKKKSKGGLFDFGDLATTGAKAGAIGASIAAGLHVISGAIEGINKAAERSNAVDDMFTQLQTQTSIDLTGMKNLLLDVSTSTGKTIEQTFTAASEAIDNGLAQTQQQAVEFSGAIAKSSTNLGYDMEKGSDSVLKLMNSFGMTIDQTGKVTDSFQKLAAAGDWESMDQMVQTTAKLGPVASQVGLDFETFNAILSEATTKGMKAEKIEPAIRSIGQALKDNAKVDQMKALGVEGIDFATKKITDFSKFVNTTAGNSSVSKLFGGVDFDILVNNLQGNISNTIDSFKNLGGETNKAFQTMQNTAAVETARINAHFDQLQIVAGESFSNLVNAGKGKLLDLLEFFGGDIVDLLGDSAENAAAHLEKSFKFEGIKDDLSILAASVGEVLNNPSEEGSAKAIENIRANMNTISEVAPYTAKNIDEILNNQSISTQDKLQQINGLLEKTTQLATGLAMAERFKAANEALDELGTTVSEQLTGNTGALLDFATAQNNINSLKAEQAELEKDIVGNADRLGEIQEEIVQSEGELEAARSRGVKAAEILVEKYVNIKDENERNIAIQNDLNKLSSAEADIVKKMLDDKLSKQKTSLINETQESYIVQKTAQMQAMDTGQLQKQLSVLATMKQQLQTAIDTARVQAGSASAELAGMAPTDTGYAEKLAALDKLNATISTSEKKIEIIGKLEAKTTAEIEKRNAAKSSGLDIDNDTTNTAKDKLKTIQDELKEQENIDSIKAQLSGYDQDSVEYQNIMLNNAKEQLVTLKEQGASELELLQARLKVKNISDKILDIRKKEREGDKSRNQLLKEYKSDLEAVSNIKVDSAEKTITSQIKEIELTEKQKSLIETMEARGYGFRIQSIKDKLTELGLTKDIFELTKDNLGREAISVEDSKLYLKYLSDRATITNDISKQEQEISDKRLEAQAKSIEYNKKASDLFKKWGKDSNAGIKAQKIASDYYHNDTVLLTEAGKLTKLKLKKEQELTREFIKNIKNKEESNKKDKEDVDIVGELLKANNDRISLLQKQITLAKEEGKSKEEVKILQQELVGEYATTIDLAKSLGAEEEVILDYMISKIQLQNEMVDGKKAELDVDKEIAKIQKMRANNISILGGNFEGNIGIAIDLANLQKQSKVIEDQYRAYNKLKEQAILEGKSKEDIAKIDEQIIGLRQQQIELQDSQIKLASDLASAMQNVVQFAKDLAKALDESSTKGEKFKSVLGGISSGLQSSGNAIAGVVGAILGVFVEITDALGGFDDLSDESIEEGMVKKLGELNTQFDFLNDRLQTTISYLEDMQDITGKSFDAEKIDLYKKAMDRALKTLVGIIEADEYYFVTEQEVTDYIKEHGGSRKEAVAALEKENELLKEQQGIEKYNNRYERMTEEERAKEMADLQEQLDAGKNLTPTARAWLEYLKTRTDYEKEYQNYWEEGVSARIDGLNSEIDKSRKAAESYTDKLDYLKEIIASEEYQNMTLEEQQEIQDELQSTYEEMWEFNTDAATEYFATLKKITAEQMKQAALVNGQAKTLANSVVASAEILDYQKDAELLKMNIELAGMDKDSQEYKDKYLQYLNTELEYEQAIYDALEASGASQKEKNEQLLKIQELQTDLDQTILDNQEEKNELKEDEYDKELARIDLLEQLGRMTAEEADAARLKVLEDQLAFLKSIGAEENDLLSVELEIYKIRNKETEELMNQDAILSSLQRKRQNILEKMRSGGPIDPALIGELQGVENQISQRMRESGFSEEEIGKVLQAYGFSGYKTGGRVDGLLGYTHGGEYVLNADSVKMLDSMFGKEFLDNLNVQPAMLATPPAPSYTNTSSTITNNNTPNIVVNIVVKNREEALKYTKKEFEKLWIETSGQYGQYPAN